MRTLPEVRRSIDSDRDPIVSIWADAFGTDPVIRWFLPDDETYARKAHALFGFIFDVRHHGGEVWVVDGLAGAAWTPPGGLRPMVPTIAERWASLSDDLASDEIERMDVYNDRLDPLLPPDDNWYLGVLGTTPGHHGEGHGTAVVRPVLERASADGIPQSLETCVPANRDLYHRWGFEVTGEFSVENGSTVWVMVRP